MQSSLRIFVGYAVNVNTTERRYTKKGLLAEQAVNDGQINGDCCVGKVKNGSHYP
jgi:hypothetical protein